MKICWCLAFLSAFLLDQAFATSCNGIETGTMNDWGSKSQNNVRIPGGQSKKKWKLSITFNRNVKKLNPWQGTNGSCQKKTCTFENASWNKDHDELYLEYELEYKNGANPSIAGITLEYCSDNACSGGWKTHVVCGQGSSSSSGSSDSTGPTEPAATTPDTIIPEEPTDTNTEAPVSNGKCSTQFNNYKDVIHKSLLFYEAQRAGKLPSNNRVPWRRDSAMDDGQDVGLDLSGGYYDAGDFVMFGFPAASALTVLSWGGISYKAGYETAGELDNLLAAVKWGTDWFIKCHVSDNELYAQVGNGVADHAVWCRPEEMNMARPSYKINCANPGSDMAAEAAAMFASASILFKEEDSDYSAVLLDHAEKLYSFADTCRGKYSDAISDAKIFYNSWSGYGDELAWGAAWLFKATRKSGYLNKAKKYYNEFSLGGKTDVFSWDNKAVGVQVLLAELTGEAGYKNAVKKFCDQAVNGQTKSPGGQLFYMKWGSLRYASNAALVCLQAADVVEGKKAAYTALAEKQMSYILGDNPKKMSFVAGYGNKYPKNPHHAASACPNPPASCGWGDFSSSADNTNVLIGALVGGPSAANDNYTDKRDDYIEAEVTLDYNAGFQSVLAGLQMKKCNE